MPSPEAARSAPIRLGVASWLLGPLPLAERLRWAAESGFRSASLLDSELAPSGASAAPVGEIARSLEVSGLEATVHAAPGPSDSLERKESFARSVAAAAELQRATGRVLCFSIDPAWRGGRRVEYDPDATLRALQQAALALEGLGVAIAVENWKINPEPAEFGRLAAELAPARLGLVLDLGHLNVASRDPARAVGSFPIPVHEVHVHDNAGDSDDHLPLGRGSLPLAEIASAIRARGEPLAWTLEIRAAAEMAGCTIADPAARETLLDSLRRLSTALARRPA